MIRDRVSLAQVGLVQIAFSFPVDFCPLPCRLLDPSSRSVNTIS
jgi:hypothetical protein